MSDSKIGHVVAIISVLATAATAVYSEWDKGRTEVALEGVKAQYEALKADKDRAWTEKKERCSLIIDTARNLGQAYGQVYQELDLDKRSAIDANLWAAATMLSAENQKIFLAAYQKGPAPGDSSGLTLTNQLVSLVLQGLATDGQKCLSGLQKS